MWLGGFLGSLLRQTQFYYDYRGSDCKTLNRIYDVYIAVESAFTVDTLPPAPPGFKLLVAAVLSGFVDRHNVQ